MQFSKKNITLLLGPLSYLVIKYLAVFNGLNPEAIATLAITAWIAIWWIFEPVPIPATALLPLILFPLNNVITLDVTSAAYGHKFVFLFLGGFILANAVEKWSLHKRIALNIIRLVGTNLNQIVLGFMVATGFLSMWISNTATAVMLLPVALAIVYKFEENPNTPKEDSRKFGKALMLAIAYSSSLGGMATLIGTPPNLVFAGVVQKAYNVEITFAKWFMFGFPVSLILLIICWLYLTKYAFTFTTKNLPGGKEAVKKQLSALGALSFEEKLVLSVFSLTALAWITRSFLLVKISPKLDDTIIAIIAAVLLFVLPSKEKGKKLMAWSDAVKLPWGILILFGGGMALAQAFESSGLAVWIASQLNSLQGISVFLLILILIATVNFLTEVTSNLATTAMLLPVLIPLAVSMNVHPYLLMVGATLAASCAFMLPVATPPNAIVFASGYLSINDMVKKGFVLNLISIGLLTLFVYYFLPLVWGL